MMLSHPALLSVWVGFILSQDSFFPGSSLSPAWQSWGKKAPLSQKLLQKSQDSLCLDQLGSMHLARAVLTTWNIRLLSCTDTKPTCPLVLLEFRNCHQQRPFCLIVLRLFSLLGCRSSFLFFFFWLCLEFTCVLAALRSHQVGHCPWQARISFLAFLSPFSIHNIKNTIGA